MKEEWERRGGEKRCREGEGGRVRDGKGWEGMGMVKDIKVSRTV